MTDSTTDLDLAEQADLLRYMPWGPAHREAAATVLAAAQERGDLDAEFAARMRLTAEGVMSGISELALANFAWCAAKHAEDPARFVGPADDSSDTIFWQYKWMPGLLSGSPAFSAAQIFEVLDDFEATYRKAGLPLSAVAGAQFETAIGMGRVDDAVRLGEIAAQTPRDDFSSCAACTPANYVDLALLRGDEAEAIKIALQVWDDGDGCAEEPESMLSRVLLPLLRAGNTERALEAYEYSYDSARGEADQVENQSLAALFASITGNHDIALAITERHLAGLGHGALRERDQIKAGLNFAVVLDRYAAARRADVAVRASTNAALQGLVPDAGRPLRVPELASVLWGIAEDLAARFDERNGTDYWAQRLAESRALVAEEHPLALGDAEEFTAIVVLPDAPESASDWAWRAVDSLWVGDATGAEEAASRAVAGEASPPARLRALGALCSAAEMTEDVAQFDQHFAAYVDEMGRQFGEQSANLALATRPGTGPDELGAALEAFPEASVGLRLRAASLMLRPVLEVEGEPDAGALDRIAGIFVAGIARLEAELAQQDGNDERYSTALSLASAHQQLGQIRFAQQQPEAAIAACAAGAAVAPSHVVRAAILTMQGNMLGRVGAVDSAAELFDEAATLYAAGGFVRSATFAAMDAGAAWANADNPSAAVVRFDFAQSLLRGDQDLPVGAQWKFSLALIDAGEADRAVPMLEGILAAESADPTTEPGSIAQTHFRLARAYDVSYDKRAGAHYRESMRFFSADDAPLAAAQAATYAAREFRYQEQWQDAIEAAHAGLAELVANPEPALEFELLKQLAGFLADTGDTEWRARADQVVEVSHRIEDPEAYVDALGNRAVLEFEHGDKAASTALAQQTLDEALARGIHGTAVGALSYVALSLIETDRVDDAVATLERYRGRSAEFGDHAESLGYSGVELLQRVGRDELAATWIAFFDIE